MEIAYAGIWSNIEWYITMHSGWQTAVVLQLGMHQKALDIHIIYGHIIKLNVYAAVDE